jgi:hypothetical protein
MTIQYDQKPEDFEAASRLLQRKVQYISFGIWVVLGAIIQPSIRIAMAQGETFSQALHDVVGPKAVVLFAIFLFPLFLWLQPIFTSRRIVARPVEWTFLEEGVEVRTPVSSSHLRWDAFVKFREDRKVLLLYIQKGQAQFIAKRVLSAEQLVELQEIVSRHVKKA